MSPLCDVVEFTVHIKLLSQGRCYGCYFPAECIGHKMTAKGSFIISDEKMRKTDGIKI